MRKSRPSCLIELIRGSPALALLINWSDESDRTFKERRKEMDRDGGRQRSTDAEGRWKVRSLFMSCLTAVCLYKLG